MLDSRAAMQPLEEAAHLLERLRAYETPDELTDAVRGVWQACDRAVRLLVRSDAQAPDALRLNALAPGQASSQEIVAHLRRRDAISIELAGMLHELERAAARAASGSAEPGAADSAVRTHARLRSELDDLAQRVPSEPASGPQPPPAESADVEPPEDWSVEEATVADRRRLRRLTMFAAAIFFVGGVAMLISLLRGPGQLERDAIEAFRAEQFGVSERAFRALSDRDADNVTARLYLGRIYRRQGRMNEAAEVLQAAASQAPEDGDVRRELGHLFMDLRRPESAATQFRAALEADPEENANWIGLIQALRAAGDPTAEEWLRRAPAAVRAALTAAPPARPFGSNGT